MFTGIVEELGEVMALDLDGDRVHRLLELLDLSTQVIGRRDLLVVDALHGAIGRDGDGADGGEQPHDDTGDLREDLDLGNHGTGG